MLVSKFTLKFKKKGIEEIKLKVKNLVGKKEVGKAWV